MKKLQLMLIIFLFATSLFAQTATAPSAGNGTESTPYQIATLENLYWLSQNSSDWDKHFIQTADIDATTTSGWNNGEGWSPIGNSTTKFTGSFNGAGHTILNLYINRPNITAIGLFGHSDEATIDKLGLVNCNILGGMFVGGIVGTSNYSTISNSYSTGTVSSSSSNTGGLVGKNLFSTISNSYSTCVVSGHNNIGGLVGSNLYSDTRNCYSTGSVSGNDHAGGLLGENIESTVTNSYYNSETSGQSDTGKGTPKTTAQMKEAGTFIAGNWDFSSSGNVWTINGTNNNGYPFLRFQNYGPGNVWLGTASSEWITATNWSENRVPTNTIIIPNVSNAPIISSAITATNITIESGAVLTLSPTASLTATGTLTNNSMSGLIIQANASGTGQLLNSTAGVQAIVESYLVKDQWHVLGIPVNGQEINELLTNSNNSIAYKSGADEYGVSTYNETENDWNGYFTSATSGNFENGTGYLFRRETTDGTISFSGTLATGNVLVNTSKNGYGWNCIGNPYPSAIGVTNNASSTANFLAVNTAVINDSYQALYVWDPLTEDYIIINNAGSGWATNYIQAGQGFFVRANAPGNLVFNQQMQSPQASVQLKSEDIPWASVVLTANQNSETAKTSIAFNEGMSLSLDPGYDAGVFKTANKLHIYTQLAEDNGIDFGLQCLPLSAMEGVSLPVGLESVGDGEVAFTIEQQDIPAGYEPVLEDRLLGIKTQFTSSTTAYDVNIAENSSAYGRFYLSFGLATSIDVFTERKPIVYYSSGEIIISGEVQVGTRATLHDIQGRKIMERELESTNRNTISVAGLNNGIYLLSVRSGQQVYTYKIPLTGFNR